MPTFDEVTPSEMAALKQRFNRDGFLIINNYLSVTELEELRNRAVPLAQRLLLDQDPSRPYQNMLKSLHKHDDWFAQQLVHGRHVPLIRNLMGTNVSGMSAAWFDRPKDQIEGIMPHLDSLSGALNKAGATIWFALDPIAVGNGCVHYLRYSHKNIYPPIIPIPGIDTESADVFAAELGPGDVVIHHASTVHWSGVNQTGLPRRAVSYFYSRSDPEAEQPVSAIISGCA
jgi:hypothetical protein